MRAEAGAPGGLRESRPRGSGTATRSATVGHERRDLRERHRRQLLQRSLGAQVERLRDEIDHGLVRHRALDLVAVGGERTKAARARVAPSSRISRLLPMPGSPSISTTWPDAGGEPREQADEQAVLVAAADERRGLVALASAST